METKSNPTDIWSGNKTQLIVIRSKGNSGKTTTCWMVLMELLRLGARLLSFSQTFRGPAIRCPLAVPAANNRFDFVAELLWNGKTIVISSMGDVKSTVEQTMDAILATKPDFVVCTSRSQYRTGSTWELFETKYTNILYRRVCFWSEYSVHPKDELLVKESTIEAIVKFIK